MKQSNLKFSFLMSNSVNVATSNYWFLIFHLHYSHVMQLKINAGYMKDFTCQQIHEKKTKKQMFSEFN